MDKRLLNEIFNEVLEKWYLAEISYEYLPEGEAERLKLEKEELLKNFNNALND
ncbi:hypothetical protein ACUIJN_11980 [Metabacillus halosaccharovorans]|uniref:hypothetical protein n=1 Tax=Metabacillus halosaccharovorans TaxID=930124 RepID=UPI00403D9943